VAKGDKLNDNGKVESTFPFRLLAKFSFVSMVGNKEEQQIVNLLLFFYSYTIEKPSGLPDSNFIFFVATKKTKQKKTWRCAWHVWLDIPVTSIQ
jgi:hypothetical protein